MEKNVYKMKGKDFIPIVGTHTYTSRIRDYHESVGKPKKGTKEFDMAIKGNDNAAIYQVSTGCLSMILAGIAVWKGLEALLK